MSATTDHTEPEEPRRKAVKTHHVKPACMNNEYRNPEFIASFLDSFLSKTYRKHDSTHSESFASPFRHVSLQRFISDDDYIEQLITELQTLDMRDKNNDLYKFKQSIDLQHVNLPYVNLFRGLLQDQMLPWLRDVTRFPLNDKVDMFCSNYDYTDVLLCHDDELEERHIAYIYYLVPESWNKEDGGTLDLFDTDDKGQPGNIVKSFVPAKNMFLFFEVTPGSFHQVAEVLAEDKTRLAISGWFHGPPIRRPSPYQEPLTPVDSCGSIEETVFIDWINPVYVSSEIQSDIKDRFISESEIELSDFLKEEKYDELLAAMESEDVVWTRRGPANKRNYDECKPENLPAAAQTLVEILRSDAMFLVLSSMTGLQLRYSKTADAGEGASNGNDATGNELSKCRVEVQRFKHGDYTLLSDTDPHLGEVALDVVFFIGRTEWSVETGGYISYLAKGEDEELLKVSSSPNFLALVYKDKETMRFVKHVNHSVTKSNESQYYCISVTYYENAD